MKQMYASSTWKSLLLHLMGGFFLASSSFAQVSPEDSLLPQLLKQVDQWQYKNLDSAMDYAQEAMRLAHTQQEVGALGKAHTALGRTYANLGQLDSALSSFRRGLAYTRQTRDSMDLGNVHSKLHYAHLYLGNPDSSLFHALESLRYFEAIGEARGTIIALNKASESLYEAGEFSEGIRYSERALALAQEIQDSMEISVSQAQIASQYLMLQEYDSALSYQLQSLSIQERIADDIQVAIALNSLGNIQKLSGDQAAAAQQYQRGIQLAEGYGYKGLDRTLKGNLGDVYVRLEQYREGLGLLREVYELDLEPGGNKKDMPENLQHMATAFAGLGQYDSAYVYRLRFAEVEREVFNEESDARFAEMQTLYEMEKITSANERLGREKQRQRWLLWAAALALLAILSIVAILYRNNQRRKQTNDLLNSQKTEIEQKNQQNELLLKEIHHRVKNNLQVISSLLRLQTNQISDPSIKAAVAEGEHRVKSMALIHQKLYQRENLAGVEMKDYLETMGKSLLNSLGSKDSALQLDVNMDPLELDVDTAVPLGLIANELITNSLKYAFPNQETGKIEVSLQQASDQELVLRVIDDGVGQADAEEGSTSFGTKLIRLLCIQLDGKMEVDTQNGRKTEIRIGSFQSLAAS